MEATDALFSRWVNSIFDHPVAEPAWYWTESDGWDDEEPSSFVVACLTRAFENSLEVFRPYSNAQLNQGLWYLLSPTAAEYMSSLRDDAVPISDRLRCINSFYAVYADLFTERCSPVLSYTKTIDNPLNAVCFMWWDILPIYGQPDKPERASTDDMCLSVMKRTLGLESDACREAALHGLGHWHYRYPERVESIVDSFLSEHPDELPDDLKYYAFAARLGRVQ